MISTDFSHVFLWRIITVGVAMKIDSVENMVSQSQSLKNATQNQDRQIAVTKKMRDSQEQAVSSLLANAFNGVGQVVNKQI